MYYERSQRRRSSPRRVLILLILVGIGIFILINQNGLRQRINPPPTPTATRTARSYVVEAESLAQTGNLKAATDAYIQAVSLEPDNVDVLVTLSRLMALTDRTAEAVKWAERVTQIAPQSAVAQAALAMALNWHSAKLLQQGRDTEASKTMQQALAAAKTAVSLDPSYPEAHAYLAEIYADLGDIENAGVSIQKALALDPSRSDVQRALGYVRENEGNYTGAVAAYRKAIGLTPNIAYLYLALGRNYRAIAIQSDNSAWQSALDAFKHGTEVDPTNVTLLDELGWSHYQLEQYRDAQEILEQAVQVDPQAWSPRSHLAATYFARTNYEDAVTSFQQAIEMMNQDFDADHYCVTAKTRSCDRLVAAYTTMGMAYYYLAIAYKDLSRCVNESMPALRKVLILRPDDPTAQTWMSYCAKELGTPVPNTPAPRS